MQQNLNVSTYYLQPWAEKFFSQYKLTDTRNWVIDYLDNTYNITTYMKASEVFDMLLTLAVPPDSINYIAEKSVR